jgi:ketosteroid isomerase-like protein
MIPKLWLAMLLLSAVFQTVPVPQDSNDVKELTRLETVWNQAYVHGDAAALEALCSDDLIATMTDMQVLNKAQSLGILRSGRVKFQRYETSDLRIRVYGNAAVVTGRLQRTRLTGAGEANDSWRFTKVYVRHDNKWQVVAWHASTTAL